MNINYEVAIYHHCASAVPSCVRPGTQHHQSEPSNLAIELELSDGGRGTFGNGGGARNALGLQVASGLGLMHVDWGHWASTVDFDMKDKDGGSLWGLGSEEGPGLVSRHTPTSKKKSRKPKK
jgi:hypothetical protein